MERDPTMPEPVEAQSAVSWGAVLAGAVAAIAVSLVLLAVAGGFGLAPLSPWPGRARDVTQFTPILGSWIIVIQVLSSALGGYLAGRLRTRWAHVHGHEAHFRDTAHGLLAWAVSILAGAILLATVATPLSERAALLAASAQEIQVTSASAADQAEALRLRLEREANLTAQASMFMGVGLLLGAFTASVAAAIGGLRNEEMHTLYWSKRAGA